MQEILFILNYLHYLKHIKMGTLITLSGINNPQVFVTTGTPVTGTIIETESAIIKIPANTLLSDDMISIRAKIHKSVVIPPSISFLRMYHNNAPTLIGATLIATASDLDIIRNLESFYRELIINGTNLFYMNPLPAGDSDDLATVEAVNSFIDMSNDLYFIFSIENGNLGDVCTWTKCVAKIFR